MTKNYKFEWSGEEIAKATAMAKSQGRTIFMHLEPSAPKFSVLKFCKIKDKPDHLHVLLVEV